jgi:hypothetical protein
MAALLWAAPQATHASSTKLSIPTPSAGDGTIVQATLTLRRHGSKARRKPKLKVKGLTRGVVFGGIKRIGKNRYLVTVVLLVKKPGAATASRAAGASAAAGFENPLVTVKGGSSTWGNANSIVDLLRLFSQLATELKEVTLQTRLAEREASQQTAEQVAQAIRDAAAKRASEALSQLLAELGTTYPAGFPSDRMAAIPSLTHSGTGAGASLCVNVRTAPPVPNTTASVTLTRVVDSAPFGTQNLMLTPVGTGRVIYEINTADSYRAALSVAGPSGPLLGDAVGIGPEVSPADCPPG